MISAKSIFHSSGCVCDQSTSPSRNLTPRNSARACFHPLAMAVSKARDADATPDSTPRGRTRDRSIPCAAIICRASAVGVHGMVVSESADAARAGVEILKQGGNAVDAAVATALAVGVTNPASCGIGGGGFMLIYMAKAKAFYALDYRETAPLQSRPDMYMRGGKPDEDLARDGILGVGVPGEIAGIDAALRRFGTMKFQQIAAPAEKLADEGYAASPHLAGEIAQLAPKLKNDPGLSQVFLKPDGSATKAGDTIVEKNLAATLKSLGNDPVTSFYHGEVANALVAFMKAHGGLISATDLANYR